MKLQKHDILDITGSSIDTDVRFPDLIVNRFELVARIRPDAVAVVEMCENKVSSRHEITYGHLNRMANQVGNTLISSGIGQESVVGVAVDHNVESIAAILGIMKAGACFLPVDENLPELRIKRIIEESRLSALIVPERNKSRYTSSGITLLAFDECLAGNPLDCCHDNGPFPESSAYVIYTSGSTGEPKGVLVTQEGLANHAQCFSELVALGTEDSVLQFATLAFDAAYEEIFPCLCRGAKLVLRHADAEKDVALLLSNCDEQQITLLDIPTAYWQVFTRMLGSGLLGFPASIRSIVIGGEEASSAHVHYWRENHGRNLQLLNTYGPTEATIITTASELLGSEACGSDGVSLGTCIPRTSITLYNQHGQTEDGHTGEIYISGVGVARGYINAPGPTAERFVPDAERGDGRRLYRTGDLAARSSSGELLFKGRRDNQVKLNGHRIQLEEVENALLDHPSIASCAVLLKDNRLGGKHLVAYCVPKRGGTSLPFEETPLNVMTLRNFLRERIPEYMLPGEFSILEKFIVDSRGKIDRSKLPEVGHLDRQRRRLPKYQRPKAGLETRLAEIWCDVLDLDFKEISAEDPFEYLGGNSLYSIQVRYNAQQAGLLFKASDLHLRQTIRGLAGSTQEVNGTLSRIKHLLIDYLCYMRGMSKLMARETTHLLNGPRRWKEARYLRSVEQFYSALDNKENIFYVFFTRNLLHWLSATLSFVPSDCNIVLIGAGLSDEEVNWVRNRVRYPFLHLQDEIDLNTIWDILFSVNQNNFGWLDVDCLILNPCLFQEMRTTEPDIAINSLWTHAACGPTKRPFHVLESYFLFFNIAVLKKLRGVGILPRASASAADRRQIAILKKLIPSDQSMRQHLETVSGKAFIHRLLNFEFAPLVLYQLLANACGFKLNRVRFLTEIDSFNFHNYYSDEAIHVFPSIRYFDTFGWSGIDQKLRLASDYLLMTSMLRSLPPSYLERKRFLESKLRDLDLNAGVARALLYEYLALLGVTDKTFNRREFHWLTGSGALPSDTFGHEAAQMIAAMS